MPAGKVSADDDDYKDANGDDHGNEVVKIPRLKQKFNIKVTVMHAWGLLGVPLIEYNFYYVSKFKNEEYFLKYYYVGTH